MKLHLAIDFDNTWSAAPKTFKALGKAVRKAGGTVTVVTGNPDAEKELQKLGAQKAYDAVHVHAADTEQKIAESKAKWLDKNNANLLIDNNAANVGAATTATDACLFFPKQPKKLQKKSVDLKAEIRRLKARRPRNT